VRFEVTHNREASQSLFFLFGVVVDCLLVART
jgi:hypothetical protein